MALGDGRSLCGNQTVLGPVAAFEYVRVDLSRNTYSKSDVVGFSISFDLFLHGQWANEHVSVLALESSDVKTFVPSYTVFKKSFISSDSFLFLDEFDTVSENWNTHASAYTVLQAFNVSGLDSVLHMTRGTLDRESGFLQDGVQWIAPAPVRVSVLETKVRPISSSASLTSGCFALHYETSMAVQLCLKAGGVSITTAVSSEVEILSDLSGNWAVIRLEFDWFNGILNALVNGHSVKSVAFCPAGNCTGVSTISLFVQDATAEVEWSYFR